MLALLGSGEFEPWAEPLDRRLIESSANGSGRVIVVPTASAPEGDDVFDQWAEMGIDHYLRLGARPEVLPLKTREDALRPEMAARVAGASLIFFSGGNPGYLCEVMRGTPFWAAVLAAMGSGTSLGGCSAGACMLGAIAPEVSGFEAGREVWVEGMKVFPSLLFGPHWDAIDGFRPGLRARILAAIPDGCVFVGIDERTAMIGDGRRWEVAGRGRIELVRHGEPARSLDAGETFTLD